MVIGGAVDGTSSGLGFSDNLSKPAAAVGVAGGIVTAGLGLAGLRAQNGKTSEFDFTSNMLAEFFDRPTLSNSTYPPLIWPCSVP